MKNRITALAAIVIGIVCFELVQQIEAVAPPPDGGYPNGNTAEGQAALLSLTAGAFNTAVGFLSLRNDMTGSSNTAIGAGALALTTSDENTAVGAVALLSNTAGNQNTAYGASALIHNTEGVANTAIGRSALFSNTTGTLNTALGASAGNAITTASNVICIGTNFGGDNVSNSCFIANIRGTQTAINDAVPVLIDSSGQLGTASSSRRFKKDIEPMAEASDTIMALKPVTFHYKDDQLNRPEFGLIAEEVAAVNPNLVVRDKGGAIYTVRYDAVNAMLLNEFLKEHSKVEEQQCTIAELKSEFRTVSAQQQNQIQLLTDRLEQQSAQLRAVTAQVQMNGPTLRVAADTARN
jgi:hypothetical protein